MTNPHTLSKRGERWKNEVCLHLLLWRMAHWLDSYLLTVFFKPPDDPLINGPFTGPHFNWKKA